MILAADTLPGNDGYVAAAYIVFLVMVLIYVVIMAIRLSRVERDMAELNELADQVVADEREREHVAS